MAWPSVSACPCFKHSGGNPARQLDTTAATKSLRGSAPRPGTLLQNRAREHATQDTSNQDGWQLVRRGRWWRKERRVGKVCNNSELPASRGRKDMFHEKVRGKCYNCFAKEHIKAHCREPAKCWKCKGNGHISHSCPPLKSAQQCVHLLCATRLVQFRTPVCPAL